MSIQTIFDAIEKEWAKAYSFDFVKPQLRDMSTNLFTRIRAHIEKNVAQYKQAVGELKSAATEVLIAACAIGDEVILNEKLRKMQTAITKLEELE